VGFVGFNKMSLEAAVSPTRQQTTINVVVLTVVMMDRILFGLERFTLEFASLHIF
jgi:hypothetical protein